MRTHQLLNTAAVLGCLALAYGLFETVSLRYAQALGQLDELGREIDRKLAEPRRRLQQSTSTRGAFARTPAPTPAIAERAPDRGPAQGPGSIGARAELLSFTVPHLSDEIGRSIAEFPSLADAYVEMAQADFRTRCGYFFEKSGLTGKEVADFTNLAMDFIQKTLDLSVEVQKAGDSALKDEVQQRLAEMTNQRFRDVEMMVGAEGKKFYYENIMSAHLAEPVFNHLYRLDIPFDRVGYQAVVEALNSVTPPGSRHDRGWIAPTSQQLQQVTTKLAQTLSPAQVSVVEDFMVARIQAQQQSRR